MAESACIFGCAGPRLTAAEAAFFRESAPWGFILFRRNIETPEQVTALIAALRESVGREAPILVDQEGGRVARFRPPHWPTYPPGRAYGQLAGALAAEMAWLGARLMANDLTAMGVNVDCLPVLDVPAAGADDVIGDRAYASEPGAIARLGRAAADGLMAGGVLPVMKHIPGHGRSHADSHKALPVVEASRAALARDFAPFQALADLPMAMTAHIVFSDIDPSAPATTSRRVIDDIIRGEIGFDGLLMSDDLSMHALTGPFDQRASAVLAAGCDLVLHCNGDPGEMNGVAQGASPLAGDARRRADAALARIAAPAERFDAAKARARFEAAFQGQWTS